MQKKPIDLDTANPKPRSLIQSLKVGLIAAILAAIIAIFLPNYYASQVTILPSDNKGSGALGQMAAAAAAIGVSVPGSDSTDANFADIVNSRTVREDLLNAQYQFHVRSWRFGAELMHQESLLGYLGEKNMDRAVARLGSIVSVSKDPKTKILTILVETKSPELSYQIAERATADLEDFVMVKGRTHGSEKARFAEERLKESREDLAKAEEVFRGFLEGNRNYQTSADPAIRLLGSRLEEEFRLKQQIVATLAISREQALLESKNDVPIVNVLDAANLPLDHSRPRRTFIVLLTFLAAAGIAWVRLNREWIKGRLFEEIATPDGSGSSAKDA